MQYAILEFVFFYTATSYSLSVQIKTVFPKI